jgi:hypothetical protein
MVALGHEVKQVPPAYAKPFRQGHKNDFRDAHAVAEAVQRPSTRCAQNRRPGLFDHLVGAGEHRRRHVDAEPAPGSAACRQGAGPGPRPHRGAPAILASRRTISP